MKRERTPSAVTLCVLGSLLLHAAVLITFKNRPTPPVQTAPPAAVELEVVERPTPPAPASAPTLPAASPIVVVKRLVRASPAQHTEPITPLAADVPADVPDPAKRAPNLTHLGASTVDRESAVVIHHDAPRPRPEREIVAPPTIEDPNARTEHMIAESLGRDRVQRGVIDPYFAQLGNSLAKTWKPTGRVTRDSLVDNTGQLGENVVIGLRAWLKVAEKFGRTGSPVDGETSPDDPLSAIQEIGRMRESFLSNYREVNQTVVRITQGSGGLLQDVQLIQASSNPDVDAQVLDELRTGVVVLPTPPPTGRGITNPIRSVWAFQLVVSVSPPLPSALVTGTFDVDDELDVRVPLDRRIYKYVQLVSVE